MLSVSVSFLPEAEGYSRARMEQVQSPMPLPMDTWLFAPLAAVDSAVDVDAQ